MFFALYDSDPLFLGQHLLLQTEKAILEQISFRLKGKYVNMRKEQEDK